MGMPAATITSQTAHGGIVTVGYPQVLINFMPASRIGDLHVCPMVTGVVPHVGGPFVLGAMTVLVGMMPQSRVTDQLVCVGPPDVCVMGATTVLVGMAGAGGAAGAMGGISAMGVSVPMAPPSPPQPQATLQSDGSLQIAMPTGSCLPPFPVQQAGWPDLPPAITATFQSVQPVTLADSTAAWAGQPAGVAAPATQVWTEGTSLADHLAPRIAKLLPDEKKVAEELISEGHAVAPIDRDVSKTADFFADGVRTELKTLQKAGPNTLKNAIENAVGQSDQNILIDARKVDISMETIQSQVRRAEGNLIARGKITSLAGRVSVLTKQGKVKF